MTEGGLRFRRVVSGQDAAGRSILVSDEQVEGGRRGTLGGAGIWGGNGVPSLPHCGEPADQLSLFPGPGGWRFSIMVIYSDDDAGQDRIGARSEELQQVMEAGRPGMHATDTVDVAVILSGEASIELDDGVTATLRVGDSFVQNGTRHRWFNAGSEPAVVGVTIIGAVRN